MTDTYQNLMDELEAWGETRTTAINNKLLLAYHAHKNDISPPVILVRDFEARGIQMYDITAETHVMSYGKIYKVPYGWDEQSKTEDEQSKVEEVELWKNRYYQLFINIKQNKNLLNKQWPDGVFDVLQGWANEVDEMYKEETK